jgi:outer membrane receptor for monomeric catechols
LFFTSKIKQTNLSYLFKNTINYILSPSVCTVCDKLIEFYSINEFKKNDINLTNISKHLCKSCYYNIPLISNHNETKTTILKNIKVDELYVDIFYSLIDNKIDDIISLFNTLNIDEPIENNNKQLENVISQLNNLEIVI